MQHSDRCEFALVKAMGAVGRLGGPATGLATVVPFGAPALCVPILGLLALRVVPARSGDVVPVREVRHR